MNSKRLHGFEFIFGLTSHSHKNIDKHTHTHGFTAAVRGSQPAWQVEAFVVEVDRRLGLLCDERMVLKTFEGWPERRLECLRESVARAKELQKLKEAWDPEGPLWKARNNIVGELENIRERFEASQV